MLGETKRSEPGPAGSGASGPAVGDPTLFLSFHAHKHLPGRLEADPRLVLLEEVDRFAQRHGLESGGWPFERAADVDLVRLDRSTFRYERLVNLRRRTDSDLLQCVVYAHSDALVVQITVGAFGRADSLAAGWSRVSAPLGELDEDALAQARHRLFGASAVLWALTDGGLAPGRYDDAVVTLAGREVRLAETDIGALWHCDIAPLPAVPVSQDMWVLVTQSDDVSQAEANRRYSQPRRTAPCDFAVVALARHKSAFEREHYLAERDRIERIRGSLDRRARWLIDTQRYHGEALSELGAPDSLEFQEKLTRAQTSLADFRQTQTLVEELRRTLLVNRTNFLVNCVALLSADGERLVAASEQQDHAAAAFLEDWRQRHTEDVFGAELGRMHTAADQVASDADYSARLVARHASSLHAGAEQLQVAGQRQLAEMSRYHSLEAAAVVASLAAIVTAEVLAAGHTLEDEPVLGVNAILLATAGAFALVQVLAGRGRPTTPLRRAGVALFGGFVAGFLVALGWGESTVAFWVLEAAVVLGTALLAGLALWLLEVRAGARHRRRRSERAAVEATLDKVKYALEELTDLLEDLPPTTAYRVKKEDSLLEKIERKRAAQAERLGLTAEELERDGAAYAIQDINDVIGIRYVVAPWRLAEVVDRVCAVTDAVGVDHKATSERIGEGRYRGFRTSYKSVHVDVDLWGVGARKDVNLLAEVQVRTPLQDLFANWFHDVMYKERPASERRLGLAGAARAASGEPGTAPWLVRFFDHWHPRLNRPLARVLIWLGDLELWLFRATMEWPRELAAEGRDGVE